MKEIFIGFQDDVTGRFVVIDELEELIAYDNASIAEQDVRGKMKFVIDKTKKEIVIKCYEKN